MHFNNNSQPLVDGSRNTVVVNNVQDHLENQKVLTREQEILLKHKGHESLHAFMLFVMLAFLILSQVGLVFWKKNNARSFEMVTLGGLVFIPLLFSVYAHYVRFVVIWTLYMLCTGYFVSKPFLEKPMNVKTPRKVYWFFFLCNKISFGVALLGYVLMVVDALAGKLGIAPIALMLLFYGLLFGVISRDLASVCADKISLKLGVGSGVSKDGSMPTRFIPDNRVCAICCETLDSVTEHSVELPNCGHTFHSFCIRGWRIVGKAVCPCCSEKVELSDVFQQPWEKQSVLWSYVLDVTRYLVVWNPLIIICLQLFVKYFDSV